MEKSDIPTIRIIRPREPFVVIRKLLFRLFERNEEVYIRAEGNRVPKMVKLLNTLKGRIEIRSLKTGLTKKRGLPDHAQVGILEARVAKKGRNTYDIGFCSSNEYRRKDVVKVVDDVSPVFYVLQDFQEDLVRKDFLKEYKVIESKRYKDMVVLIRKDIPDFIESTREIDSQIISDLKKKHTRAQIVEVFLLTGKKLRIMNVNFSKRSKMDSILDVIDYLSNKESPSILFGNFRVPLYSSTETEEITGVEPSRRNSYYLLHKKRIQHSFQNRNVLSNPSPKHFEKPVCHALLFPRKGFPPSLFKSFRAIAIKGSREAKYVSMLIKFMYP